MATEPEAKETDGRPGPLTSAARRRPPAPQEPPAEPAWNLSDELEGLEGGAEHVEVRAYVAPPGPLPRPRPRQWRAAQPSSAAPPAPSPPRERSTPGGAAAVVSISLVTLAVLLQLASVLSSR